MTYRIAAADDEPYIRALLAEARLPAETLGTGATTFFIAEQDRDIVGVAGFEYYGPDALLRSVAIRSSLRNTGIGSSFADWMLSQAASHQIKRVVLLTETAKKFFEKKGFTVIDRSLIANAAMANSSEFVTACPTSAIAMVLNLTKDSRWQRESL